MLRIKEDDVTDCVIEISTDLGCRDVVNYIVFTWVEVHFVGLKSIKDLTLIIT